MALSPRINAHSVPLVPCRWLLLAGACLVAGCSDDDGGLTAAPPPFLPPPAYVHTGAITGVKQKVRFFDAIDPGCKSAKLPSAEVDTSPSHGQVWSEPGEDIEFFNSMRSNAACSFQKIPALDLFYRSDPTFSGTDNFELDVEFRPGRVRHYYFTVTVVH